MKTPLCLLAPLLLVAAAGAQQRVLHNWDFSQARVGSAFIGSQPGAPAGEPGYNRFVTVPDTTDQNNLVVAGGAAIVEDPDAPGGKALHFDGSLEEAARSVRVIEAIHSIRIRARFKPDAGQAAPQQTIVSLQGAYELRYNHERRALEFILMYGSQKYTIVRAPARTGAWNDAVATFKDGLMILEMGSSRQEASLPEGTVFEPRRAQVRVGRMGDRPFKGALSEIQISEF